ncbi:FxSxx-COOH system tetratricopeptide repeat protein [Streptomyces sp. NPDC091209]|uniref:FxSxx-COOH system tetratricopeptide repeat protein n=1 Tax=Streptomyces sp. NPDC091209 TaxID=3365974 RepID=UPI0037FC14BF
MSTTGSTGKPGSSDPRGSEDAPGSSRPAKIVTFYSFKGGAGRTMALANAAWIIASKGKSVLVIDWDLEAPDLHLYYGAFLPFSDLGQSNGVLEMFSAFAGAATAATPDEIQDDLRSLHPQHTDFERYQVDLDHRFPNGGRLHYMGPGRMDEGYADRLAAFNWSAFHTSDDGKDFLEALRTRLRDSDYDYILIDSRTGFSDGARICTLALPDEVVIALTMNPQAIQGARRIAELIRRQGRDTKLHFVQMRVDQNERDRLDQRFREARQTLDTYVGIGNEDELAAYWGQMRVPYVPYYTYGEELAVMREDPRVSGSIVEAYVRLVDRITDGEIGDLQPPSRTESRSYRRLLEQHERSQAELDAEPGTVTLLHAPNDQLWADWIGELLRPTRMQIVPPAERPDDTLPDTTYVLGLLSPHLAGTQVGDTVARLATGAHVGRGPGDQRVIGVRVSPARLAPHFEFAPQDTVTLDGQNEDAARQELLGHFGLLAGTEPESSWSGPRFPGLQPAVWNMPRSNAGFVGRTEHLDALRQGFDCSGASYSSPQVLCGLIGTGKRQIALEYAHQFASQYDLVWRVPATSAASIQDSLAELAQALDVSGDGSPTGGDWRALLEDLRVGRHPRLRRWLLVFEGAANQQAVEEYIPTGGTGHVLITSNTMDWTSEYTTHDVMAFTPEESLALLGQRLPGLANGQLQRLAERLGHLPIAEQAAAAALRTCPEDIDLYIDALDSVLTAPSKSLPPDYQAFIQVCRIAYDDLRDRSPAAARLLELCAFLSPNGVGMDVVRSKDMVELLKPLDPDLSGSAFTLFHHLNLLREKALAVQDLSSRTLRIHRVVQDLVRGWMPEEKRISTRSEAQQVLASMVPSDLERHLPKHHDTFAELDRHVIVSGAVDSTEPKVHAWLVSQVYHRWMSNDLRGARELGEHVLERWRETLGPEHLMVLRMESQLGAACRLLGDHRTALALTRHAVTHLVRENHTAADILLARRGYAADLRAAGQFKEAFEEDQKTFSRLRAAIGEDANGTLAASHNLALSKFYVESVPAAIRQERDAHERREGAPDRASDPKRWVSYAHLGTYHRELGELAQSELYLTRARDQLHRLLDPGAQHVLGAVASLSMTMVRQGDVQHGLPLLKDAYVAYRDQWGEKHPRTMACRLSLAIGLHAQDRTADAIAYARDVLGHYVDVYDEDHPFTAICRNNLALYLLVGGEPDEAKEHAVKAVVQLKAAFHRKHRYTLVARMNQNNCLAALGELPDAEVTAEDQDIYDSCKEESAWGRNHPVTLTALANLCSSPLPVDGELAPILKRKVAEHLPRDHGLARALLAEPYQRVGADLEVQGV